MVAQLVQVQVMYNLHLLHLIQIQHLIQNQHPTPRLLQILTQLQIQHLPLPLPLLHQQHSMVLLFQQNSQNGANTPVSAVGSSTLDNVTVNGINITLKQPGITARTFTNIRKNTETTIASGTYLSHMRFGAYADFNHNNNPDSNPSYTFALGSVTPVADVPTSGTATYNGLAVGSVIGGGAFQEGTSTFNVDFGAKKLDGSVTIGAFNPIPLTANINGNQFSGTSAEGVHTDGRFYGPQAAEMGGVFNGEVPAPVGGGTFKWIGSFGAKK